MNNLYVRRTLYGLGTAALLAVVGFLTLCFVLLLGESGLFGLVDRALTKALFWRPEWEQPEVEVDPAFLTELRAWCATSDGVPTRALSEEEFETYVAWMSRYAPAMLRAKTPDDFENPAAPDQGEGA